MDFDPAVHDEIDALAERIWARIVGAHADPIEFNLRAKLALEMRMLGSERPPFGLDRLSALETAIYIGVQTATLQEKHKRRALGIPEPYNIGRKLYWRRSEVDPWLEKQSERRPNRRLKNDPDFPQPLRIAGRRYTIKKRHEAYKKKLIARTLTGACD